MALTDSAIRALKPREAACKAADEKGLYLMVTPAGGKLWKLKFRTCAGTEKKLSPLVLARPGELRRAKWLEIDLDAAIWRIPAAKMKGRIEHVVPLSRHTVDVLKLGKMVSGHTRHVFPSIRSPKTPMSENTVNAALSRLGFTGDDMPPTVLELWPALC